MAIPLENTDVPDLIPNSTVPIYGAHDDFPLVQDRSGVLAQLGRRYFIFTAVHDFDQWLGDDGQLAEECALFISSTNEAFHIRDQRGQETLELEVERIIVLGEKTIDVAAIEISAETTAHLKIAKTFVHVQQMRSISSPPNGHYVVFGHPFAMAYAGDPHDEVQKVESPVAWFHTHPVDVDDLRPYEQRFALDLPSNELLHNRTKHGSGTITGFSGCGIWYANPDCVVLVGILNLQSAKGRYVVGTSLKCVLEALAAAYPDIAQDVSGMLAIRE